MALQQAFLVFVGGGFGALSRYGFGIASARLLGLSFPAGTLGVNIIGSTLMGFLIGYLAMRENLFGIGAETARLLLATGFLGGFTTFSAFSLDVVTLYNRGETGLAAVYIILSLALSVGGLLLGLFLARSLA